MRRGWSWRVDSRSLDRFAPLGRQKLRCFLCDTLVQLLLQRVGRDVMPLAGSEAENADLSFLGERYESAGAGGRAGRRHLPSQSIGSLAVIHSPKLAVAADEEYRREL